METSEKRWWILTAMCLFTVMLNIDVTAINIAVPVIAKNFNAKLSSMQWVINAYVLVSSMLAVLGGRLGDTYGHKKMFLWGVVCFVLSSAGAGLSLNESMLIAFRTLQGVSLGIAYPLTIALTFASFPKTKQGFALSFIVGTMGVSLAIGPPIGGLFVNYLGWRWIFFINVPLGILVYIITKMFCSSKIQEEKKYIDVKGSIFLILGLFGVTYALNQVQNIGMSSPTFLFSFFIGIAFLVVLFFITRKQSYPIIDFKFFKNRNFTLNNCIRLIVQLVFIPVLFFMPLYLQNIAGYDALYSGILLLFLTVVIGVISPIAGKWIDRAGDRVPNILSMILFTCACVLFYFLSATPEMAFLAIGLLFVGIGTGITFVSTVTGSVAMLDEKDHGVGTGILFTVAWFGCALGIALMGAIVAYFSESYLVEYIKHAKLQLSTEQMTDLKRISKGIASYKTSSIKPHIAEVGRNAFMHGFKISMAIWGALAFIGILLSLALKKHRPKKGDPVIPMT